MNPSSPSTAQAEGDALREEMASRIGLLLARYWLDHRPIDASSGENEAKRALASDSRRK